MRRSYIIIGCILLLVVALFIFPIPVVVSEGCIARNTQFIMVFGIYGLWRDRVD